jgi:copper chaperone CopZ
MKTGILKISGIFCGGCTYAIEKAGRRLEGVHEVRVNPGTGEITVNYDGSDDVLEKIVKIIETLGHESEIAELDRSH